MKTHIWWIVIDLFKMILLNLEKKKLSNGLVYSSTKKYKTQKYNYGKIVLLEESITCISCLRKKLTKFKYMVVDYYIISLISILCVSENFAKEELRVARNIRSTQCILCTCEIIYYILILIYDSII